MELILKNALIIGSIFVFFALLRAGAKRPAQRDPETGELILQCAGPLVWTMGVIAVGGPLSMGVLSFIIPFQNTAQVFVPFVLGGFFLLLGGLMCLWALRRRTRIGERGLTSEYIFTQPRFLPWNEVTALNFSSGQELWVIGASRQKAMLHVWYVGIREAVPLLREHLPPPVQQEYASVLDFFASSIGAE